MKEHIFDILIIAGALIYALLRVVTKSKKKAAQAKSVVAKRDIIVGKQSTPGTVVAKPVAGSNSRWDVFKRILEHEDQEWDVFRHILDEANGDEQRKSELVVDTAEPETNYMAMAMEEGGRTTITQPYVEDEDEIVDEMQRKYSFADYKKMEAAGKGRGDAEEENYFNINFEETYDDILNDFNLRSAVLYSEILNPKY